MVVADTNRRRLVNKHLLFNLPVRLLLTDTTTEILMNKTLVNRDFGGKLQTDGVIIPLVLNVVRLFCHNI